MRSSHASSTAELVAPWLSSSRISSLFSLNSRTPALTLFSAFPFFNLTGPFFLAVVIWPELFAIRESSPILPAISPRGARCLRGVDGDRRSEFTNAALERSVARVMRGMACCDSPCLMESLLGIIYCFPKFVYPNRCLTDQNKLMRYATILRAFRG